jgi:hypothetical protein
LSEGLGDLLAKIMFEPIPVPSSIVPTLPREFDAWWARASSRQSEYRFHSAKDLADTLAVALGISGAATVAAAPPGLREASLSDYSLSMSDGEVPQETQRSVGAIWPLTQTGKLLAAGVVGVIVIASSISLQSGPDPKKGQTLITPSTSVASPAGMPTALPEPPPSMPGAAKTEATARTVEPATTSAPTATAPVEPPTKTVEKAEKPDRPEKREEARRSPTARETSPRPPKTEKPKPPPPVPTAKPKIDFGI